MSEKNNKDSYAQNTLQFSVPHQQPRKNPPQGHYPNRQNPNGQYPNGQRPNRQYPGGNYPNDPYQNGNYPNDPYGGQYNNRQSPNGKYNDDPYYNGQYPQGNYPQGQAQRPHAQNGQPPRQQNRNAPHGQRPAPQNRRQAPQNKNTNTKPKKKRRNPALKILFGLLIFLVVIFIIYSILAMIAISKVNKVDTGERIAPSHDLYKSSSVRNILLIGNDARDGDSGRSDSMILLSINSNTNKMNLVSIMRDSYVDIPGYGWDKLNAAYSIGGPELLMDTIQENFYVEINDYISINFTSFADIVDAVGGVEIEVNDDEADAINVLLDSYEGVNLFGEPKDSDYLNGAGTYKLNGKQALCYSRLRKVGNADFERTERQRKVLSGIMKNIGPTSAFSMLGSAFPDLQTNMSGFDMYLLSLRLPILMGFYDMQQLRIPVEDSFYDYTTDDGQSALGIDIDPNLDLVEYELYADK